MEARFSSRPLCLDFRHPLFWVFAGRRIETKAGLQSVSRCADHDVIMRAFIIIHVDAQAVINRSLLATPGAIAFHTNRLALVMAHGSKLAMDRSCGLIADRLEGIYERRDAWGEGFVSRANMSAPPL